MGQYYRVLEKEGNKRLVVYNRNIIIGGKEKYTSAKLMEHSWWYNEFVNAICEKIYNSSEHTRIIWMGDYADHFLKDYKNGFNDIPYKKTSQYFKRCWGEPDASIAIPTTQFNLHNKYLVNHTKQEYIDCSAYYKASEMEAGWCIHPLPLLTCIGNRCGGGDYLNPTLSSSFDLVGMWAWDELSIEDKAITEYDEIFPIFKEDWS